MSKMVEVTLDNRFYPERQISIAIEEYSKYTKLEVISRNKDNLLVRFNDDRVDNLYVSKEFLNYLIFLIGKE